MGKDKWWTFFIKGLLMGICDVVPGISGGTIAFITGIYERLMTAIAHTFALCKESIVWLRKRKNKPLRKAIKQADMPFLGILFAGILVALLLGSRGILYLLDNHFAYTISFFLGLIVASAVSITHHIKERSLGHTITFIIGVLVGVSFLFYAPLAIIPSTPYLFMAGFLAVSALFLPGISGSFILLLLGIYEYVLGLIRNIFTNLLEILVFVLGAVLGAYVISKIVKWLFAKHKARTLYGLLGLVIGSLGVPIKRLLVAGIPNQLVALLFALIGLVIVMLLGNKKT